MSTKTVYDELIGIIGEFVTNKELLAGASLDTNIIRDLRVNSARLVDIIIKVEDTFSIEINDDDADSIKTIGDAVNVVRRKMAAVGIEA